MTTKTKAPATREGRILKVIADWNLNKAMLARKTRMNAYTFKMKLSETATAYKFTKAELDTLEGVLKELAADIEIHLGISFNKALATKGGMFDRYQYCRFICFGCLHDTYQ
jgi:hypothetical protein